MEKLEAQAQLREEISFLRSELQSGMVEGLRNEFAILKKDLLRELRNGSKDGAGSHHHSTSVLPIGIANCQAKWTDISRPRQGSKERGSGEGPAALAAAPKAPAAAAAAADESSSPSPPHGGAAAWESHKNDEITASSQMVRFCSDSGESMNTDEASIASEQLKAGSRFLKRGLLRRQNTPWTPPRLTRVKSGVSEFVSRKLSRDRFFSGSGSGSASRRRVSEASTSTEETTASNGSGTDPTSSGPIGIRLGAGMKWQAEFGKRVRQVSVVAESTLSELMPQKTCAASLRRFIFSLHFDYLSCLFVIFNAVLLGVQTDWQARHVSLADPVGFYILEVILCLAFMIEVGLRIWAYGWDFCAPAYRWWHAFDCALLAQQVFELCWSTYQEQNEEAGLKRTTNLSILRMTRILRMIRVMRLVRILRLIGELRMLIISIVGSLRALFWAMLLLTLLLYVMSIYVTQLVLDHRLDSSSFTSDSSYDQQLVDYYGSNQLGPDGDLR